MFSKYFKSRCPKYFFFCAVDRDSSEKLGFPSAADCRHASQLARAALARIMQWFLGRTQSFVFYTGQGAKEVRSWVLNHLVVSNDSAATGDQNLY